jgi:hydrogenase maturation protein HypF
MTSGNLSDEPICFDDADARDRLGRLAGAWLTHDRPIHVPCDDSVLRVVDGDVLPIRRSRGYVPLPVSLPFATAPVLAVGGELKNTFCTASGETAWVSQHVGDMGSVETLAAFERATQQFREMYGVGAELIAADAHPGYQTRRWAETRTPLPVELVQHHHAHVASVMAENGIRDDTEVIGFAFDGTGYGRDGTIWGGEALIASYAKCQRAFHLRCVPLPGGDAGMRKPYRAALAHLRAAGIAWAPDLPPVRAASAEEVAVLERQLERGFRCVPTSSMGRLFDAVASLTGLRHVVSFEAQAAMQLESVAVAHRGAAPDYRFEYRGEEVVCAPVVASIVADLRRGLPPGAIALGFHLAVAHMVADVADRLRGRTRLDRVALSGGVFQNGLLLQATRRQLGARGFDVLTHRAVPPNDGGLALGQVAVAGRRRAPEDHGASG